MFIRIDENSVVTLATTENDTNIPGLIEVNSVPDIEYIDGKICKQVYDETTKTVSNIFEDIQQEENQVIQPTLEDKINYIYYKNMGVI